MFRTARPAIVGRVAEVVGTRFAAATAMTVPELARDDSISPEDLAVGLVRAHLLGAVSAIAGAVLALEPTNDQREAALADAADLWKHVFAEAMR